MLNYQYIEFSVINDVSILHNDFDQNQQHPRSTDFSKNSKTITYAPKANSNCEPHNLIGRIKYKPITAPDEIDFSAIQIPNEVAAKMANSSYTPTHFENCTIPEGQSVAIIIPFRDNDSKGYSQWGSK